MAQKVFLFILISLTSLTLTESFNFHFDSLQQSMGNLSSARVDFSSAFTSLSKTFNVSLANSPFLQSFTKSLSLNISLENPPPSSVPKSLNVDLESALKTLTQSLGVNNLRVPDHQVAQPWKQLIPSIFGDASLSHGSDCSWEAEKYRKNLTRDFLNLNLTGVDLNENYAGSLEILKQEGFGFIAKYRERAHSFCPFNRLLVCDKLSQKCVCGDSVYETIFGLNRSMYVLETNGNCRWNTGSYCHDAISGTVFETYFKLTGVTVDLKCRSGTLCKTKDGDKCSLATMGKIVKDQPKSPFDRSRSRPMKWSQKAIAAAKICSCQQDIINGEGRIRQAVPLKRKSFRRRMNLWENMTRNSDNFS